MIAEGIVDKPDDLDVASVMAMGFPPYRQVDILCAWKASVTLRQLIVFVLHFEYDFCLNGCYGGYLLFF